MTCNSLAIARPTSQTPLQIFAMEIMGRSLVEANEDFDKAYQEYYKLG